MFASVSSNQNRRVVNMRSREMLHSDLRHFLRMLLILSWTSGIAACGQEGEPVQEAHRFLRESHSNRSGIDDNGFGLRAGDNDGHGGIHEGKGYFWLNGKNWTSETQFVQGGGRCQTESMSDAVRAQHHADLKSFHDRADNDDGLGRRLQVTNTILVNWVVISQTNGVGRVTRAQMNSQINVLNAAFAPQFRFQIYKVKRVVNDYLFTCTDKNELTISSNYRIANPAILNLYTCYPPGYLGWAYFPFGGNAGTVWDFSVVAYNSVPGGNLGAYSYGHVSILKKESIQIKGCSH
jgi:hypothetical protein